MIPSEFNSDVMAQRRKMWLLREAKIMLEAISIEGVDTRTGEVILRIPEGQPSKAATRFALLAKRTSGASFGVMKGRKPDVGKLFSFKIPRKSPIEVSKILRKELGDLFREETLIEARTSNKTFIFEKERDATRFVKKIRRETSASNIRVQRIQGQIKVQAEFELPIDARVIRFAKDFGGRLFLESTESKE